VATVMPPSRCAHSSAEASALAALSSSIQNSGLLAVAAQQRERPWWSPLCQDFAHSGGGAGMYEGVVGVPAQVTRGKSQVNVRRITWIFQSLVEPKGGPVTLESIAVSQSLCKRHSAGSLHQLNAQALYMISA